MLLHFFGTHVIIDIRIVVDCFVFAGGASGRVNRPATRSSSLTIRGTSLGVSSSFGVATSFSSTTVPTGWLLARPGGLVQFLELIVYIEEIFVIRFSCGEFVR